MRKLIRRFRAFLHRWSWLAIGSLILLSLLLGYLGFREYFAARGVERSPLRVFYLALQLFTLESGNVEEPVNWKLELARLLAPGSIASAAARAFWGVLTQEVEATRLILINRHAIVCGLGNKGVRLVQELHDEGHKIVVIENDADNDDITRCRELGAIVIVGSANEKWTLRKARILKASFLFAVTGDDGANVETALLARELNGNRSGSRLKCVIHVVDPDLESWFERHGKRHGDGDLTDIKFFNVYKNGASKMLGDAPFLKSPAEIGNASRHLIIVGMGRLGEAVFQQAATHWRTQWKHPEPKLEVTIVDQDAVEKMEWLRAEYPDECDACLLHAAPMQILSASFKKGSFLPSGDLKKNVAAAYVCVDDDSLAVRAALTLHEYFGAGRVPIVVRMTEEAGLASLFDGRFKDASFPADIRAVGLLDLGCRLEVLKQLLNNDEGRPHGGLQTNPLNLS